MQAIDIYVLTNQIAYASIKVSFLQKQTKQKDKKTLTIKKTGLDPLTETR